MCVLLRTVSQQEGRIDRLNTAYKGAVLRRVLQINRDIVLQKRLRHAVKRHT